MEEIEFNCHKENFWDKKSFEKIVQSKIEKD
jgi:hypothetical protein